MPGTPEITLARNGVRVALVYPNYPQAEAGFEDLLGLAPDASSVNRGSGKLAIEFEGGGLLRFVGTNLDPLRGSEWDQVIVHPDAWTEALAAEAQPAVAATGGVVRIADAGYVIACSDCGALLSVAQPGWTLRHDGPGNHTAIPSKEQS